MKIKPFSRHATADALSWLLTGAMVLLVMLFLRNDRPRLRS